MPLYEYECGACGKRFELIRKFSDGPVDVCTLCGKGPVTRLFSSPAIQFKGSGFYITDYVKKGEGGGGKGDSGKGEGGKGEGGESATSDKAAAEQKSDAKSDAASADKASKSDPRPAASSTKSDTPSTTAAPAKPAGPAKD